MILQQELNFCENGKCEVRLINVDPDNLIFDLDVVRRHQLCVEGRRRMGKRPEHRKEYDSEIQRIYEKAMIEPVMERVFTAIFSWWGK